jgi:hypothetical protein
MYLCMSISYFEFRLIKYFLSRYLQKIDRNKATYLFPKSAVFFPTNRVFYPHFFHNNIYFLESFLLVPMQFVVSTKNVNSGVHY